MIAIPFISTHRFYKFSLLFILAGLLLISGCRNSEPAKKFRIGFSQCGEDDNWRKSMLAEMKRELAFHPELEFIYTQADYNSEAQIAQVKNLLEQKIDVLIISPNEAKPLTPIVEDVFNKGIPVVVVDRKIASTLYTNYLGADNYQIGKMAGEYAASLLHEKGNIIEVTGLPTSSPAIEREKGFQEGIRPYANIKIIQILNADWTKDKARLALEKTGEFLPKADLIFAHNDVMALGASEAVKTTRLAPIKIIGVDALPGAGSGMSFVSDKLLTASLLYPTGGAEAIRNVIKILRHEPLQKETRLQTLVIDSTNVRMMNMQYDKILAQQHDIEQQQDMLKEQQRIYNTQRTLLYVLVCTLVLSVFFAGLLFYSRQLNKKINTQLAHQNEEITRKSEQLVKMSAKAAEAHEARLNFFTNISHEFRTPLTLIISPLQEMLKNPRLLPIVRQQYSMINKNANRLLRLVNQLIDFRKVEFNKMKIKASANELVSFTKEVVQAFQEIAVKRNIDCRLITREQQLPIWIDANIMDQVLFNLLSNAFKFTPDGGSIIVRVDKNVEENKAILEIQDTGAGMTEKEQEHAFEIFYQGDHENHKGSGIGLALSRQLVSLHHGTITLHCQKGKGCTFTIHLPLGNAHLDEIELMGETNNMNHPDRVEQEWLNDLLPVESPASLEGLQHVSSNLPTILLIEDHPELREFIKLQLSSKYQIIEADNGISALQFAFDYLPDLIICDVMIPGKDGITVTSELKNDLRTAHIPIIILTAKASVEQQVEGIKSMADAYISKPFHLHVLDQTMNNLLTNRIKLKEHYTAEFPAGSPIAGQKQQDRKFISEFKAIVENNIANDQFAIDDICKAMRISKVQLYRKTKTLMNTNINEYILNTRIQKSKYYLQHEDLTIAEVAYKTGFASAAYFSTVFKSKTGTSPTLFKEKKNPSA